MDPETNKFSVSRDVIFDEISSYYDREDSLVEPSLADSLPISSFGPSLNPNDKSVEKQRRVEATAQDDFSLVGQENGGAEEIQMNQRLFQFEGSLEEPLSNQLVMKILSAIILVYMLVLLMIMSHLVLKRLVAGRNGSLLWMMR